MNTMITRDRGCANGRVSKVSVITPTLNCAATITECRHSVASQDYDKLEHLFIDGESTDGTLELIKSYNIDIISEKDTCIYDAINMGIARATDEIIHILNADDWYKQQSSQFELS